MMGKSPRMGVPKLASDVVQFFLPVCVDDKKMAGGTRNVPNMWSKLQKEVDLDEPSVVQ